MSTHDYSQVPPDKLERWQKLEAKMRGAVFGQDEAMRQVATALLAGEMGHATPRRPKTFGILLGPTGTGKTQCLLTASEHLYGTDAIIRLNMAEFQEKKDLAQLRGEDRTDGGLLGLEYDRVSALGGCIILIDEIEKAHKDIANVFLGMEAAELTLANRRKLNLEGWHILCTSNLGSADAIEMTGLPYTILAEHIEQEAMQHFRPEVWARFTNRIVFRQLPFEIQVKICQKMLGEELALQGRRLQRPFAAGDGVFRFLVARGFHETLGARPMRNAVEYYVRQAIVAARLQGLPPGPLQVALRGERFVVVPADPGDPGQAQNSTPAAA